MPDIAARAAGDELSGVVERTEGEWCARVAYAIVRVSDEANESSSGTACCIPPTAHAPHPAPIPVPMPSPAARVASLSYSSLGEYARCGYRFYLERVLGLPALERAGAAGEDAVAGISAQDRGVLVHALLETLDFRRGRPPSVEEAIAAAARVGVRAQPAEVEEAVALVQRFLESELGRRLAAVADLRREEPFGFVLEPGGVVVSGYLDVLAREGQRMIVVDYKTDRLAGADPGGVVAREYQVQRLVYSLATLKGGAEEVEVVHTFLEVPERPVSAVYVRADAAVLEEELAGLAAGVLSSEFTVTETPHRALCRGCPGEGGLCSWPLELTRREHVDTLF